MVGLDLLPIIMPKRSVITEERSDVFSHYLKFFNWGVSGDSLYKSGRTPSNGSRLVTLCVPQGRHVPQVNTIYNRELRLLGTLRPIFVQNSK